MVGEKTTEHASYAGDTYRHESNRPAAVTADVAEPQQTHHRDYGRWRNRNYITNNDALIIKPLEKFKLILDI